MFEDRIEAGRALAGALSDYREAPATLVLGIPRGGVIVAAEVAAALGLPLGAAVAAKVGAPGNSEYAVGAVAADGDVTVGSWSGLAASEVSALAGAARAKVADQVARLHASAEELRIAGRSAILVDDGLATGLTAMAAADWLKRSGAVRVVVAAPVASADAVRALRAHADEVTVVEVPEWFQAVGQFYRRFGQTTDAEVAVALGL